ncbi:hypothetical protein ACA910_022499 [Epithemia clementina (nom. ined.)]
MEHGSLLNEALKRGTANSNQNALLVDAFLLPEVDDGDDFESKTASTNYLLCLAEVCVELNDYIQRQSAAYPWLQGGDGPVFGIHVSTSTTPHNRIRSNSNTTSTNDDGNSTFQQPIIALPHLRAKCRYGASVADEWTMIGFVLKYTKMAASTTNNLSRKLVFECTDVDDGQILFIQAADSLPDWVDQIGSKFCRHRCWIRHGQVELIEPDNASILNYPHGKYHLSLSLLEALRSLGRRSPLVKPHAAISGCINDTVTRYQQAQHIHKAATVIPLSLKKLLERRPDLLSIIGEAFATHCHDPIPKSKMELATEQEWVWTTQTFARTSFAMLRSIVAPPDWKTEFSIPPRYQCPQVKRLQRQCQNQSTPHLRHGLQIGIRLVTGMDALIRCHNNNPSQIGTSVQSALGNTSTVEKRVMEFWPAIVQECQKGSNHIDGDWIRQAWKDGPNHSTVDLGSILKCPVYSFEVENEVAPLSRPGISLIAQIRQELQRSQTKEDPAFHQGLPAADDVDKEDWMTLPTETEMESLLGQPQFKRASRSTPNEVDGAVGNSFQTVLDSVQTFMEGQSSYEGVSHVQPKSDLGEKFGEITSINPRTFLNLLHFTLKANSGSEVEEILLSSIADGGDEFFSSEDYAMGADSDGDDCEGDQRDPLTVEMMEAMDHELETKPNASRAKDNLGLDAAVDDNCSNDQEEQIHLLSNLIKSLEAGSGVPGPVNSLMTQLGQVTPMIVPQTDVCDDSDESSMD